MLAACEDDEKEGRLYVFPSINEAPNCRKSVGNALDALKMRWAEDNKKGAITMTENEAIEIIRTEKQCLDKSTSGQCKVNCGDCKENIPIAYQEKAYETAISALREVQRYRQIGTIEECHKAVEKQKPIAIKEIYMTEYICPFCGSKNLNGAIGVPDHNYCPECGQAIYWEG